MTDENDPAQATFDGLAGQVFDSFGELPSALRERLFVETKLTMSGERVPVLRLLSPTTSPIVAYVDPRCGKIVVGLPLRREIYLAKEGMTLVEYACANCREPLGTDKLYGK